MLDHNGYMLYCSPTVQLLGIDCVEHNEEIIAEISARIRWHVNCQNAKWSDKSKNEMDFLGYRYKVLDICPQFGVTKIRRIGRIDTDENGNDVFVPQETEVVSMKEWGAW